MQDVQTYDPSHYTQPLEELKKKFTLVKELTDDLALGSGLVLQNNRTNALVFYSTKNYDVKEAYLKAQEQALLRQQIKCPTLIKLIKYSTSQHEAMCGSLYKINNLYEYPLESLEASIKKRANSKLYYAEQEILFLTDCILSALIVLAQHNIRHGYIQPKNIFATNVKYNDMNIYQISDIRHMTEMYEYKYQMMGFNEDCHLSPQLQQELSRRTFNPIYNYEKSEIYSLGVTLAEAMTLQKINTLKSNPESSIETVRDRYPVAGAMAQRMIQQTYTASDIARDLQKHLPFGSYSYYLLKQFKNLKLEMTNDIQATASKPNIQDSLQYTASPNLNTTVRTPNTKSRHYEPRIESENTYHHKDSFISPAKDRNPMRVASPEVIHMKDELDEKMYRFNEDLREINRKFVSLHQQYREKSVSPIHSTVVIKEFPYTVDKDTTKNSIDLYEWRRERKTPPPRNRNHTPDRSSYNDRTLEIKREPSYPKYILEVVDPDSSATDKYDKYEPISHKTPASRRDLSRTPNSNYNEPRSRWQPYESKHSEYKDPYPFKQSEPKVYSYKDQNSNLDSYKDLHHTREPNYSIKDPSYIDHNSSYNRNTNVSPSRHMTFKPNAKITHFPYKIDGLRIEDQDHHNPEVDEAFDRLQYKLKNPNLGEALERINRDRSLDKTPVSPFREKEVFASLPQSNVIYMHSQRSGYLNDMFHKR